MSENFDAYHIWLGIKPEDQPPNHYRLLAIDLFEENADALANAADRQMAHIRSFQTGRHSALSQKILNEISAARACLLNPQKKAAYDAKLQQELALKQPVASADAPRIELDFDVSPRPRPPIHKASSKTGRPFGQILAMIALGALLLFAAVAVIFRGGGPKAVMRADFDNRNPPVNSAQQASSEPGKVGPPATELRPPPPKLSSAEPQAAEPKESSLIAVELPKPAEPRAPTDPPEKVAEAVKAAFAKAKSPADFRSVAVDAFQLMEQAKAAGKRDVARSAVAVALAAARKAEDDELVKTATMCVLDPESKPVVNEDPSWIDILPRVDLQRDRVEGDWEITGTAVTVNRAPRPRLMLPVKIEGEYDLLLRFTRYAGSDTLYVILPVESDSCGVVLSGWFGAWSGLELIDGQEANNNSNNATGRRPSTLTNGKEYALLVKVRLQEQTAIIEAHLDDSPLFHWEGKPSSLTFHGDRKLPEPQRIGLGAIDSQVTFHSAKLRLVSGRASWADGGEIECLAAVGEKGRKSIPDAAAQERALKLVRELFQDKSSKATSSERQDALAQELLQTAQATNDNAIAQYVMLKEAGRFAVQAKGVALAFQVIEEMATRFKIDAFDLKGKSLTAICKGNLPQPQANAVAGKALALAEEALTKEEFDTAKQLGTLATEAARKSRDAAFIKETGSRTKAIVKELAELREAQAGVAEAVAVLEKSALDPAANLTLGKYRCFLKNLWSKGLPMLALGDDPTLKDLAAKELQGVTDPAEQAKLGDAWWEVGAEKTGLAKRNIQAHAGNWYQDALPGLTGLAKEKAEKRLGESAGHGLAERVTGDEVLSMPLKSGDSELSRTKFVGVGDAGDPYEDLPSPRRLLVGFNITISIFNGTPRVPVVGSIQPIYLGSARTTDSRVYGKAEGKMTTIQAKKGYAVAGIVAKCGLVVDGFKVIFMRVARTSLDTKHAYESDWIGGQGGGEEKLGGDGRPVIGIYGKCGDHPNSLGLIQAK